MLPAEAFNLTRKPPKIHIFSFFLCLIKHPLNRLKLINLALGYVKRTFDPPRDIFLYTPGIGRDNIEQLSLKTLFRVVETSLIFRRSESFGVSVDSKMGINHGYWDKQQTIKPKTGNLGLRKSKFCPHCNIPRSKKSSIREGFNFIFFYLFWKASLWILLANCGVIL